MAGAVYLRHLPKDHLNILQANWPETSPRHGGSGTIRAGLGIGEIDPAAGGEVRGERHIEQPALPAREHAWNTRQRCGDIPVSRDQPQPTGALGDQHPSVGQEGETPWMNQTARECLNPDLA
jgi:hypothetical protein